jgi:antitoxin component of MazEF toxin-antitoxin module
MIRRLIKTGNSDALTLSRDMKLHLGLTNNEVEVVYVEDGILIKKKPGQRPRTIDEAADRTEARFSEAIKRLAQ